MVDLWSGTYVRPAVWEETAAALVRMSGIEPGMRILDVGSAGGGTLFPALERIGETGSIVGIEVEEDWVEWLCNEIAERGVPNAENLLMNGQSMSFPNSSFDAIIMGMVGLDEDYDFETGRIINGAPLMRDVFRVLKPGCFLYNSNWLRQDDNEWMGELVRRYIPGCTKRGYFPGTKGGYLELLRTVGFERVQTTSFEGNYTFAEPAEWVACLRHIWKEELEQIRALPEVSQAFEHDALDVLSDHVDDEGNLAYRRTAILLSAKKPE